MNIKIVKMGVIGLCVILIVTGLLLMDGRDKSPLGKIFVPQVVMPYIIWFAGIIVFCIILPGKVGSVFD
jgi:hypothetical protein